MVEFITVYHNGKVFWRKFISQKVLVYEREINCFLESAKVRVKFYSKL